MHNEIQLAGHVIATTGDYIKLIKTIAREENEESPFKLLPRRSNKEVLCHRRHYYLVTGET